MTALTQQIVPLFAAWSSGISIYLTVVLLGVAGRMGWVELPGALQTLSNPLIILLAALVYAVEFVADKVPYVDSIWDSFHTFIRPLGAAGLGYMAGSEHGAMLQTGYAMLAGTIALDTHAVKATARLAINTSPEPFSNIAASVVEDSAVIGLFWVLTKHPWIAALIVVLFLCLSFLFLKMMWGFAKKIFRFFSVTKNETPAGTGAGRSDAMKTQNTGRV